jgi:hypothetical protein
MVTREEYDMMEAHAKRVRDAAANRQVMSDSSLDYTGLVNWLRDNAVGVVSFRPKFIEAANAIEALMARIDDIAEKYNNALLSPVTEKMLKNAVEEIVQLKAAIKPFALAADDYFDDDDDEPAYLKHFRIGDLRAARAAYLGEKDD